MLHKTIERQAAEIEELKKTIDELNQIIGIAADQVDVYTKNLVNDVYYTVCPIYHYE